MVESVNILQRIFFHCVDLGWCVIVFFLGKTHLYNVAFFLQKFQIQWCPDISPGPVQPDNGTIRGVGHKTVLLPLRRIWLK